MRPLIFPGNSSQPCLAEYGIWLDPTTPMPTAHLIVVQSQADGGTVLQGNDDLLTLVLNTLLAREFAHIRVEFVRLTVIYQTGGTPVGFEYPIELDPELWVKNGLPYDNRAPASNFLTAAIKRSAGEVPDVVIDSMHVTGEKEVFYVESAARVPLDITTMSLRLQHCR